ncbi:MAG: RHS repeat-associated core domain-containing protein [Thermogemmata sp.]|jgi:RHS repeat-associated protein|uniref:RHS repeat-associated core domain-containing protein n=1 Tax=Thermogemmata fonticola TaxID=2755323 RepID=A0A7V8VB98_9BACT|nr:RHS repeat-associated core domain-containing protein [Thermogemmata fonticola]MBA2224776.1 hypothetical protein [Thermogemmata fonticola]
MDCQFCNVSLFGQATVLDANWNVLGPSAFAWVYLHQGGRYDVTSGLYYFRLRDYSPTLGRWTSLNPLSYAAGDGNLYRPIRNNTTSPCEPSGLQELLEPKPVDRGSKFCSISEWRTPILRKK